MSDTFCDGCGRQFEYGEQCVAITGATITEVAEGPEMDTSPWLATYCLDCWEELEELRRSL